MENFDTNIAEILEVDNVRMSDELSSFECWDSLTVISIIAFVDENYHVELSAKEINDSKTIAGLKKLINEKMK